MGKRIAVVTGASSGIGRASARRLAAEGFEVVCAARRTERIEELAAEIGGRAVTCDVTSAADVAALAEAAGPRVEVLVCNAGGAVGLDPVGAADADDWRKMFEVNVIGVQQTIRALLPAVTAGEGVIIAIGSLAGLAAYEGAGGYCGSKAAVHSLMVSLRLELWDQPVRVCEIDPGMVASDEFALHRFGGDADRAAKTYAGVANPLTQEDVADCVAFVATRPPHVNIDQLVVKPRAQAAAHKVDRSS
ncbi:SDR family oxidoreductase [Rudaeicoccus suwonensis]|uniref:NADP-dependent 3-hydroxy acid dehydrogenase YdfG n=1 Tax=Rudaeicoccus suwonensis TaxID=657409 RepID=A0A561DU37_9MICO|nr:SDR family oxidoreductase [Rudaeicoccus suwonensis]TWE06885.1 NADP-dependent 3-hydroxy acid dehydrogenase YdfG [Rudaeicoccus suwonensis]